tara:strand:- start:26 stop:943 length:918 start_codon:yes stop_codon:yes gene_type:complete
MIKIFGLAGGENYHSRHAFKPCLKNGFVISSGKVISVHNNEKFDIKQNSFDESQEVYLHIKGSPLSSKIEEVNLINKSAVKQNKLSSDDLLNIYIPLGRALGKDNGIESADSIDKNFLWLKKYEDKPFAFYFDGNRVYMTGYLLSVEKLGTTDRDKLVKSSDSFIAPRGTKTIRSEPKKFLCLDVQVTLNEKEGTFIIDKYEFVNRNKSRVKVSKSFLRYTDEDMENADSDSPPDMFDSTKLSMIYPLGYIQKGNFIHGKGGGNVVLRVQNVTERMFFDTYESSEGCTKPNFEHTRIIFLSVQHA